MGELLRVRKKKPQVTQLYAHELIKLLEEHEKIEIMWNEGKPDYIRIPFNGPMSAKEFIDLIGTIQTGKQRGKMNVERKGYYIIVSWEKRLK